MDIVALVVASLALAASVAGLVVQLRHVAPRRRREHQLEDARLAVRGAEQFHGPGRGEEKVRAATASLLSRHPRLRAHQARELVEAVVAELKAKG